MLFLFPRDLLRPRRVDEHFAEEAAAAREAGHEVALIDHDAIADGRGGVPALSSAGPAVYRGWMLEASRYAALEKCGVRLLTSGEDYRRAHELPGWYAELEPFTPLSAWTSGGGREDFARACATLGDGPAVLRDYSKSMKHHWDEAAYIPDVARAEDAWRVASRFLELRGDDFTGGLVVRRFEKFDGAEVRTWWTGGVCRLITAHPDTADDLPPSDVDVTTPAPAVAALNLPFVTVDLARRADGEWRVIELGDGQVSDRPKTTPAEELIAALTDA